MSKVNLQTANNQRREVANLNRTHSAEMRALQDSFQNQKVDVQKNNESALIDIQSENLKQVAQESEKKERVLTEMKKNLDTTRELTDKELRSLKTNESVATNDLRAKTSIDRERISREHEDHLEQLNDKFNEKSRDIRYQGQREISTMDDLQKEKLSQLRDYHTNRISEQTTDFNKRFTADESKFREFKDIQDKTFKHERMHAHQRQQNDLRKLTTEHTFQLEQKDRLFQQALKDQEKSQVKKWNDTMKFHSDNFKGLDERHKNVVSQVKADMTKQVSQLEKRSDDQFYQFTELKPVLTQFPDRVEIKVAVPEHSKQDLQLTTNNKEVIVVFNRRYQDTNKNELGSSKVHRIESFTSKINVDAILDPKSVRSTYDSGTMTYTIKKA